FLAGPNMQVKSLEEARPIVAKIDAYMSSMTPQQWNAYAASGTSTRYMVTSASDAETLVRWSVATDRHTLTRALIDAYSVDLRDDIARITSPVLALGTWRGWHDPLASNTILRPLHARLLRRIRDRALGGRPQHHRHRRRALPGADA